MEAPGHAGGPDPVQALKDMAAGGEGAVEIEEAKASLRRLEARGAK